MMRLRRFTITADHIKLLQRMYVGWCDDEYGAPEIDPKRPYGNSEVEDDIGRILGWPKPETDDYGEPCLSDVQRKHAARIHREMDDVLQICLATLSFEPGTYEETGPYDVHSWRRIS